MTNQYDLSFDIYSYGVTFVEIWTGNKPYSDKNYKYHGKTNKQTSYLNTQIICVMWLIVICLFVIEFVQGMAEGKIVK